MVEELVIHHQTSIFNDSGVHMELVNSQLLNTTYYSGYIWFLHFLKNKFFCKQYYNNAQAKIIQKIHIHTIYQKQFQVHTKNLKIKSTLFSFSIYHYHHHPHPPSSSSISFILISLSPSSFSLSFLLSSSLSLSRHTTPPPSSLNEIGEGQEGEGRGVTRKGKEREGRKRDGEKTGGGREGWWR